MSERMTSVKAAGCKLAKSLELVVARVDDDVRLLGVDMENVSGDLLAETPRRHSGCRRPC